MTTKNDSEDSLLDREARFWDQQEVALEELYALPHDWRFIPDIADYIIKPKTNFLIDLISRHRGEIHSVFDIGCGNGWFCHSCAEAGIKAYGVDLSPNKIEAAKKIAEKKGISELCTFVSADVMKVDIPEQVDMISAHGSLHHFPELEQILPKMVDKFLKPDGYMLFVEPHHEGMAPKIQDFIFACARSKFMGNWFDKEHYLRVTGQGDDGLPTEAAGVPEGEEFNLRSESPAGLEFFGDEPDMGKIVKEHYEVLEEKYFHYMSGHLTNAFYTYMKPKWMRGFYRLFLPFIVWLDDRMCKKEKYHQYAEEGLWFMKRR